MLLQTNKNAYKKKEIKMIMLMNLKVLACHDQGMHDIYHCLIEKKGTPSYIYVIWTVVYIMCIIAMLFVSIVLMHMIYVKYYPHITRWMIYLFQG